MIMHSIMHSWHRPQKDVALPALHVLVLGSPGIPVTGEMKGELKPWQMT
jgi:hypothetical protein